MRLQIALNFYNLLLQNHTVLVEAAGLLLLILVTYEIVKFLVRP